MSRKAFEMHCLPVSFTSAVNATRLPSFHIFVTSVSPGMTGEEKRTAHALNFEASLSQYLLRCTRALIYPLSCCTILRISRSCGQIDPQNSGGLLCCDTE